MTSLSRDNYLAAEVLTATPQKLHLMLIEGAIRSCERARRHWSEGAAEAACEALIRAQEIVTEMVSELNFEGDAALSKKVAAVYFFVLRRLMEANMLHDEPKLDDALKVLRFERETWREVCQGPAASRAAQSAASESFSTNRVPPPHSPVFNLPDPAEGCAGFSIEA